MGAEAELDRGQRHAQAGHGHRLPQSIGVRECDSYLLSSHGAQSGRPCQPALESLNADTLAGWMTRGTSDLQTVPARLIPKNVVSRDV